MRTVTFYPHKNGIIYSLNGGSKARKRGVLAEREIEGFLSENTPAVLNVILPKPELIFRRLEFPFAGIRKILLVMPQELENILPEPPENYRYFFEFFPTGKGKTSVNVYAVRNAVCNLWKNAVKKHGSKVLFFSDTVLLHAMLKQSTSEKNHLAVYATDTYLLLNLTESGILSGSYSYDFKMDESAVTKELLSELLSRKDLGVFLIAEETVGKSLGIPAEKIRSVSWPSQTEKKYLFHDLISSDIFRKPLQLKRLHQTERFPVHQAVVAGAFIAFSAMMLSPYLKIPSRQRELTGLDRTMKETFLAACPGVTRVINPLLQMRDKLSEYKNANEIVLGYPSVLKIMAHITALFPENADASVDQFDVAGDMLNITGSTNSLKSLETIREKMESSQDFAITDMGTISYDAKNRVNFNITLRINQ